MEKENLGKMGNLLWQGRCYICVKKGFICQEPSVSDPKLKGGWKIYLDINKEAVLLVLDDEQLSINKCPLRKSILNIDNL